MMAHSSSLAAPTPPVLSLPPGASRPASASIRSASTQVAREGGVLASNTLRAIAKHKAPTSNQPKHSATKRPKPTMVTMVRSPGIRIMMSPMLRSPITRALSLSPTQERSPSSSSFKEATRLRHRSSRSRSRRKLTSTVWNYFDPIYEGEVLAGAHCVHCGKMLKAAGDVGTSSCHRHLRKCKGKDRMDQMCSQLMGISSNTSCVDAVKNWTFDQHVSRRKLLS